jgi:divalent metal cation (Fe/Co/Zn/Cd) transporter
MISVFKWMQNQWKDPVWSKVIATAIIAIAGSFFWKLSQSIVDNVNFWDSKYDLWSFKIPLWAALLTSIILIVIVLIVRTSISKVDHSDDDKTTNSTVIVDGEHQASGIGTITGLDIKGSAVLRPGTKSSASGEGNVTGTKIE